MKRVLLSVLVVGLFAWPASANMFTLNHDAAMMLWEISHDPVGPTHPVSELWLVTDSPAAYGSGMQYQVGFMGVLHANPTANPFAWMRLGGDGTTTNGADDVIGAALGTAPTSDLSAFDTYYLPFGNDDNSKWSARLFLATSGGGTYTSDWTEVAIGNSAVLQLSLAGVSDLTHVTGIGFDLGGTMNGGAIGGVPGNPSNPDDFHVSVVPVPAALILGLLGMGAAGLKLRRFA
jgi:hypothetical protein